MYSLVGTCAVITATIPHSTTAFQCKYWHRIDRDSPPLLFALLYRTHLDAPRWNDERHTHTHPSTGTSSHMDAMPSVRLRMDDAPVRTHTHPSSVVAFEENAFVAEKWWKSDGNRVYSSKQLSKRDSSIFVKMCSRCDHVHKISFSIFTKQRKYLIWYFSILLLKCY